MVRRHGQGAGSVLVLQRRPSRSADGGRTFTAIKGAPGGDDYHTIWINPSNPDIILIASDQGATITVNAGKTWSSWYNQPTAQMFHVTADNRFPYWVYGGQQESGSAGVASRSDYGEITFRDWHPVGVEEYGYAAPDPLHPGIIYGGTGTRFDLETNAAVPGTTAPPPRKNDRRGFSACHATTLPLMAGPSWTTLARTRRWPRRIAIFS